jgi:hypothetical protein
MLQSDAWRERVLEKVDPEEIEHAVYRAVFEAVAEERTEQLDGAAAAPTKRCVRRGWRKGNRTRCSSGR